MKSRKALMMEVLVAMALVTMVSSVLLLSVYNLLNVPHKKKVEAVLRADNLYFSALKDLMGLSRGEMQELLANGKEDRYDDVDTTFTVSGYSPLQKRRYYLVTISFAGFGSYNVIIHDETLA